MLNKSKAKEGNFENQVVKLISENQQLREGGISVIQEVHSGLSPFDIILSWTANSDGQQRSLVVEIDGSHHYYNDRDRITQLATDFKYRLFDLYQIPYLRLECWDHSIVPEGGKGTGDTRQKDVQLNVESIMDAIWRQVAIC